MFNRQRKAVGVISFGAHATNQYGTCDTCRCDVDRAVREWLPYAIRRFYAVTDEVLAQRIVKKYYLPYTKHLAAQARATAKNAEQAQNRADERKLAAYDSYRQEEVAKIRGALSPTEIEDLENGVREDLEGQHPGTKIFSGWIRRMADRALAEKHGVLSFDEWQKRCG